MNFNHTDFVGIYENVYTKEFCNKVITYFEKAHEYGVTYNRQDSEQISKLSKEDLSLNFAFYVNHIDEDIYKEFNEIFWNIGYKEYSKAFNVLSGYDQHRIYTSKIQKTVPMGGYHVWHSEHGSRNNSNRVLTFILYLNDVEEGGETEFLYLSRRIKPKTGTLIIWPAGFTHTHRGNPPLSGEKYIITGWVEL